jgi:signal transduction histidine kinase/nitroreductase
MASERDMPQSAFLDTILTRRSVREFKPDPIPVELLQRLLQAAQAAPYGTTNDEREFVVLGGDAKDELVAFVAAGLDAILPVLGDAPAKTVLQHARGLMNTIGQAPVIVAVFKLMSDEGHTLALPSAAAAVENLLLAAWSLGLGGCYTTGGVYLGDSIAEYLNLPGRQLIALVPLGHPLHVPPMKPRPADAVIWRGFPEIAGREQARALPPDREKQIDAQVDAAAARLTGEKPWKVLIVDVATQATERTAQVLRRAGYSVQQCARPSEALAAIATHQPDVVIVDALLPEMSGYDLCKQIRQAITGYLPVIVTTSAQNAADIAIGIVSGADEVLLKPVSRYELLAALQALLRSKALYAALEAQADELQAANEHLLELEATMRAATQAAEAANRTKSAFLANMSHEIRTPLNAILGFSQLIQRDPSLPPHQRQHLETINRSGEQLLLLIDDILNMAKIEAGRATLSLTTFDLLALLDNLELTFRMLTDAKQVQLLVERSEDLPRYVVTDEEKLRQVLTNLLGNAVKFTEEGGIVLRVSVQHSDSAGLRLLAEIEDSGPGIAAEELGKLFQPFEQTTTGVRTLKGTGLGLAISQEFARLMGGTVTVSSREGKGSTFRLETGLEEGAAEAVVQKEVLRPVTGQQPGQPRYRVLVADDNEDNRTLLELTLAAVGFEVQGVADGQQAIQAYEAWHPHLILMDMRMPVLDGFEAIRRIRASAGGEAIAIIVVTASPVFEHRQEALRIGANDFLSKPFREAELFAKIRAQLGVEYAYAEEAPEVEALTADTSGVELTATAVAALPAQLISELHAATIDADRDRLLELIVTAESHDANVGQGLRLLAQRFDYRSLLALLQTGGNE